MMLKQLMGRLKAEKNRHKQPQNLPINDGHHKGNIVPSFKFAQLTHQTTVPCNLNTIRYAVCDTAPSITSAILNDPQPQFHLLPHSQRKVKQIVLDQHKLPPYLQHLDSLLETQLPNYNHLLINVYPPGIGIMPHFDGPLYHPKVVVLSLGGPAIISFATDYSNTSQPAKLLLQDQSIHIFEREAYETALHGIENRKIDSIFLRVEKEEGSRRPKIDYSNVGNMEMSRLWRVVQLALMEQNQREQWDLSKETGYECVLLKIKDNPEFNFKVEVTRGERISVTIRHRFSE